MKKINWSLGLAMGLAFAQRAFAQVALPQVGGTGLVDLSNFGGMTGIPGLVGRVTMFLLALTGIVSVAFLIYGGMQYIFSGANEDLAKKGKTTIRNAIIGLVIVLLSYTIIRVVMFELTRP